MSISQEAKQYLLQTCNLCKHYKKVRDQEFCLLAERSGMINMLRNKYSREYGISAFPLDIQAKGRYTCDKWEIKEEL